MEEEEDANGARVGLEEGGADPGFFGVHLGLSIVEQMRPAGHDLRSYTAGVNRHVTASARKLLRPRQIGCD